MAWDTNLHGVHRAIAAYNGSPLRVVAGPGTGKTFALMRRVARFLEQGVHPQGVLAVTFTRTAASDLEEQLAALGVRGANAVTAKTLHSLSFGLLSKASVFQALGRSPRPLMDHERNTLVCDLQGQFGGKDAVNDLIDAFEAYWARLQHQQPGFPPDPAEQAFVHALREWLVFHGAMLIGELVPLALDFVQQNPAHPDIPQYDHVVVDEYQDLNRADQAFIDALAAHSSVTVVGDEDQSIYGRLRYAHPEGIVEYPQSHANTHDEVLTECRRCPGLVVQAANSVISHNQRLAPKALNALPANGAGQIHVVQHSSVDEEIRNLADYIDFYLANHPGLPAGKVLVLANRRVIGNGIRDTLMALAQQNQRAWSAQSFYFEDALKTQQAAEGFALLTLLVDPADRPALRYWLGSGAQDCRRKPYARLRRHCNQSGLTPRAALQALASGNLAIPYTGSLVPRFNLLEQRVAALAGLNVQQLVDTLFPAGHPDVAAVRQAAVLVVSSANTPAELLRGLRTAIIQPELPGTRGNAVRIMSLHKSKGLSAQLVVIAGCVSGILPTIRATDPLDQQSRQWQEQRRLFFVGLTRSTETLVLSSAVHMPVAAALQMGVTVSSISHGMAVLQASPFLAELGAQAPQPQTGAAWRAALGF